MVVNNDRIVGWLMLKEMLRVNPSTGKPYLQISNDCPNLIHSLKMIQHDEKNPNDCAKDPHEITHSADAIRYFCTSYSYAPERITMAGTQKPFNIAEFALELGDYEKQDFYDDDENFYSFEEGGYLY